MSDGIGKNQTNFATNVSKFDLGLQLGSVTTDMAPRKFAVSDIEHSVVRAELNNNSLFMTSMGDFSSLADLPESIPAFVPQKSSENSKYTVYNFTVAKYHTYIAGGIRVHNDSRLVPQNFGGQFGAFLGSTLARELAGDNVAIGIVAGSAGGALGGLIGENIHKSINGEALSSIDFEHVSGRFFENLVGAAGGLGGQILGAKLADAIGLKGVSAEFVSGLGGAYGAYAATSVFNAVYTGTDIFGGFNPSALGSVGVNFIASFAASQIAGRLFDGNPVGASIGGSIGGLIGSAWGPIGTFVGTFIGNVIGGLFGSDPSPQATASLRYQNGDWEIYYRYSKDNGNTELAENMANAVKGLINPVFDQVGGNAFRTTTTHLGHRRDYFTSGQDRDFATPLEAIEDAAIELIRHADFEGGDQYLKRLFKSEYFGPASDLLEQMRVAQTYGEYSDNSALYDKVQAEIETQTFAENSELITKIKELGNEFARGYYRDLAELSEQYVSDSNNTGVLSGDEKINVLDGLSGDDVLSGHAGNDILIGGTGNDTLKGGAGDDSYYFGYGDGHDLIDEEGSDSGLDFIQLGVGVSIKNLAFQVVGANLIIGLKPQGGDHGSWNGVTDTIKIKNWTTASNRVEGLKLFSGSFIDLTKLNLGDGVTSGTDVVVATEASLATGAGDDYLISSAGDQSFEGGAGNDIYFYERGDGNDIIHDDYRYMEDYVSGTRSAIWDKQTNREVVDGQDGVVLTTTGGGQEPTQAVVQTPSGGGQEPVGTQTYNIGGGQDARFTNKTVDIISLREVVTNAGQDVLEFGLSLSAKDLVLEFDGNDLIVRFKEGDGTSSTDSLRIKDWKNDQNKVERFVFADGTKLVPIVDVAGLPLLMTEGGADLFYVKQEAIRLGLDTANASDNTISASATRIITQKDVDGVIRGGVGDDILSGSSETDTYEGGHGDDSYFFSSGSGADIIHDDYRYNVTETYQENVLWDNQTNQEVVDGQNGVVLTTTGGGQEITQAAVQVPSSGGGQSGSSLPATYNIGGGQDARFVHKSIERQRTKEVHADGGTDAIEFDAGISLSNLVFELRGNDLIVALVGDGSHQTIDELPDRLIIKEWVNEKNRVEKLRFNNGSEITLSLTADGTLLSTETVASKFATVDQTNLLDDKHAFTKDAIVFDLDGDGIEVVEQSQSNALIDPDGDGYKEQVSWLKKDDGFLVMDRDLDGEIDFDKEVVSFAGTDPERLSLAALDSDGDGIVGFGDENYQSLRIWQDENQNGKVDLGELKALYRHGIGEISVKNSLLSSSVLGNALDGRGTYSVLGNDALKSSSYYGLRFLYNKQGSKAILDENGVVTKVDFEGRRAVLYGISGAIDAALTQAVSGTEENETFTVIAATNPDGSELLGAQVNGLGGDDTLNGSEGQDILIGGAGADKLYGNGGDDTLSVDAEDDLNFVRGGSGYDTIVTSSETGVNFNLVELEVEAAVGGKGNDTITAAGLTVGSNVSGGEGDDIISGGDGDDRLFGDVGNDTITGGAGSDTLVGGEGIDHLSGGDGDDTLHIDAADIQSGTVSGGEGDDTAVVSGTGDITFNLASASIETFMSGIGNDDLTTGTISGDSASIYAGSGNDVLNGGAGSDYLHGGSGNDIFHWSAGIDTIVGSTGNDQFVVSGDLVEFTITNNADGNSVISDANGNSTELKSGVEQIKFNDAILFINIDGQYEQVIGFETINGTTAVVLPQNVMISDVHLRGTSGGRSLVLVKDGQEIVVGLNAIQVNQRQDFILKLADQKTLTFPGLLAEINEGIDVALDQWGIRGTETSDTLIGTVGNDVIIGGAGSDTLNGDAGDDVYVFGRGDGADLIHDTALVSENYSQAYTYYVNETYTYYGQDGTSTGTRRVARTGHRTATREIHGDGGSDALSFGAGIAAADVLVQLSGNDLIVALKDPANADAAFAALSDKITISNWNDTKDRVETFRFADGSELDVTGILSLSATAGADTLSWTETAVVADFGAGDDVVSTGEHADDLIGGDGNDTLNSAGGDDVLAGGLGDDTLNGGSGNDTLTGGAGNDTLSGGTDSDDLSGGTGDDLLIGGGGGDIYRFGLGDGLDRIQNTGAGSKVAFGSGITVDGLLFNKVGNDLVVHLSETDQLTVEGWFTSTDKQVSFELSDGLLVPVTVSVVGDETDNVLTGTDSGDLMNGLGGSDTLHGGLGDDSLLGSGGSDTLYGEAGSDRLIGGTGSDTLKGGSGDDVYVFGRGDGTDLIHDENRYNENYSQAYTYYVTETYNTSNGQGSTTATRRVARTGHRTATREIHGDGGSDILEFGAGIAVTDVLVQLSGNDLIVALKDPDNASAAFADLTDKITITNWNETKNRVETFRFADGSELDTASLASGQGSDGADLFIGDGSANIQLGLSGNDVLRGEAGDDTLTGGVGNDTLVGGEGNDTYLIDDNDGADHIVNDQAVNGSDTLRFTGNASHEQLWFKQDGNDLVIDVVGGDSVVTLDNWYSNPEDQVDQIETSDGYVLTKNNVDQLVAAMAIFDAPALDAQSLTPDVQQGVVPTIAASWQQ